MRLVAGWLRIEDPRGESLGRLPTAVSREGWLALPRSAAIGAARVLFRPGQGGEAEVLDGIARHGNLLGLWRIESPDLAGAPPLSAWREHAGPEEPDVDELRFYSYGGGGGEPLDLPAALRAEGFFLTGEADVDLGRGGVLLQGDALVGWVIAEESAPGEPVPAQIWLWRGPPGSELAAERTLSDFYVETFAGGREEALAAAHALAEGEAPRARVLAAFSDALLRRPRLALEESRELWLPSGAGPAVLRAMRSLLDESAPASILASFDERALVALADGGVLLLYADAVAAVEGPEAAIALLDRRSGAWIPVGSELEEPLLARSRRLFAEAVAQALDAGDPGRAWAYLDDGRRRFPEDAALRVTEAELWLDEGDWRRAESLLDATTFPSALRDRVQLLERRISELRGTEGKIVIRFRPGAPSITTHAELSGVRQLFIVDTGASFTSIPWSTARALGLRIDASTPRRELRTASDVIVAPVVTLSAISLGGWSVPEVEATVLDLPGHDDVGLLGLNFLGAFRVDLDRAQGILTLEPK